MSASPGLEAGYIDPAGSGGLFLVNTVVLDGDVGTQQILVEAVTNRGHQVTVVGTTEEAERLLERGGFDCLLFKLRAAWSASLARLLQFVTCGGRASRAYVVAVVLDDPPARPHDWLGLGVDDCVVGLGKGPALDLRLAVAEKAVSERRRTLEESLNAAGAAKNYENLFRHAPEAILVVAARDGLVIDASDQAAAVLGLPIHEVRDKFVSLLVPGLLGREEVSLSWDDSQGPLRLPGISHRRPDGAARLFDVSVHRCFWSDRPALWMRIDEITSDRQHEAAAEREARMDAVRTVSAGAAQALNDALTAVRGNLDLLSKQNTPRADVRELLENASSACQRAEETVATLARLARSSAATGRRRQVDLRALLPRVISFAALRSHVQPEFTFEPGVSVIEVDETAFKEAVLALVENADEAMPKGGKFSIRVRRHSSTRPGPASLAVEFADAGEGVAPGNLPRLFDPYFSTRPGHQGLGLARVQAFAVAHHGTVEVESGSGQGTLFRLILPAAEMTGAAQASDAPAPHLPPVQGRVLVMDDDAGIRVIVERMLTLQGFDVYTVRDGLEAIVAYRRAIEMNSPFDVVLLDLEVRGGMGGLECVARLRGEFPKVKALLSTGYLDDAVLENHREHGFSGVVTKPFNVERLVASLSKLAAA
jgi:signal transduction histidine kinase/CheY-like chemotaxis protein